RGLRLARQRDVARRGLIPCGGDADQGLMDLLIREPHGVKIGAVRRALRTLRDMPARQLALIDCEFLDVVLHGGLPASREGWHHTKLTRLLPARRMCLATWQTPDKNRPSRGFGFALHHLRACLAGISPL